MRRSADTRRLQLRSLNLVCNLKLCVRPAFFEGLNCDAAVSLRINWINWPLLVLYVFVCFVLCCVCVSRGKSNKVAALINDQVSVKSWT